jgi:Pyridoxamine 5'-phosphate oxidase
MTRKGQTVKNGTLEKRDEPKANRLTVPVYERSAKNAGVLPWKWAADRLKKSRQYWIATTRPDGSPHLMVIWGVWLGESFWFSTGAKSRKARNLAANPKCVIGTDDAAEAVILEGAVELVDAQHGDLAKFAKAYEKKYAWNLREMAQPVYRFRPSVGFGLFEKKFEQTATRWNFR